MNISTRKDYSTHMPALIKAVQATSGPVAELGSGIYSTPLLHWLCAEDRRPLVTYETSPLFYKFAKNYRSRTHRIILIKDWAHINTKIHWSVVLVDQDKDRGKTAILLKNNADFIVLHDSEHEELYGYDKAFPHFKFIYRWTFGAPNTAVISNFKDFSKI